MSKLLIVDDSSDLLEAMQFFLEKKGYTVKTVSNSHNVFKEVMEYHPDLVVIDVYMHGKDTREVCKELRKHVETKYLCILLFSSSPKALENHIENGADGCLEKPFGLNHLVEKIESILQGCKDNRVN